MGGGGGGEKEGGKIFDKTTQPCGLPTLPAPLHHNLHGVPSVSMELFTVTSQLVLCSSRSWGSGRESRRLSRTWWTIKLSYEWIENRFWRYASQNLWTGYNASRQDNKCYILQLASVAMAVIQKAHRGHTGANENVIMRSDCPGPSTLTCFLPHRNGQCIGF